MTTLVQDVLNEIRSLTNQTVQTGQGNPSDPVLIQWVNLSFKHLYDEVITQDIYVYSSSSVNLSNSPANTIAYPSDFYRFRSMTYQNGSYELKMNKLPFSQAYSSTTTVNGTFNLYYYPVLTDLTSAQQAIPAFMDRSGWYEWVVYDCSIKLLMMLKQDSTDYQNKKMECKRRIDFASPNRNVDVGMILDQWRGKQAGINCIGPFLGNQYGYILLGDQVKIVPLLFGPGMDDEWGY